MYNSIRRGKYWCAICDWAAKTPCPRHPDNSIYMGVQWRPGKKGKKTRLWDNRVHGSVTPATPHHRYDWDKHRAYRRRPFKLINKPNQAMRQLGAVDFSRDVSELEWNDPVRTAIRAKNIKQPKPLHVV